MKPWLETIARVDTVYLAACALIYKSLQRAEVESVTLGSKCDLVSGHAFKSADFVPDGIRLLRNINVKPDHIDWTQKVTLPQEMAARYERFRLHDGDLVMSMDGPVTKQGLKIAFVGKGDLPALLLQRVCRLEARNGLEKSYLYHILHTEDFVEYLARANRSIAIPHVSAAQLKAYEIRLLHTSEQRQVATFLDAVKRNASREDWPELPPLISDQRRIVALIEELAARIEEARGLRRQSVEEGVLLVASSRARIFEEALAGETTRLDSCVTLERGKFSHRPRNDPRFFGGSHPWIQIAEIEASNKYIHDWTQTLNDAGLAISRKFPRGTLLISRS